MLSGGEGGQFACMELDLELAQRAGHSCAADSRKFIAPGAKLMRLEEDVANAGCAEEFVACGILKAHDFGTAKTVSHANVSNKACGRIIASALTPAAPRTMNAVPRVVGSRRRQHSCNIVAAWWVGDVRTRHQPIYGRAPPATPRAQLASMDASAFVPTPPCPVTF